MTSKSDKNRPKLSHPVPSLCDADELFERYGHHLGREINEAQAKAHLTQLALIMMAFVDLGFSVAPREKLHKNSDVSFGDVLDYIHRKDTAHETVAPPKP